MKKIVICCLFLINLLQICAQSHTDNDSLVVQVSKEMYQYVNDTYVAFHIKYENKALYSSKVLLVQPWEFFILQKPDDFAFFDEETKYNHLVLYNDTTGTSHTFPLFATRLLHGKYYKKLLLPGECFEVSLIFTDSSVVQFCERNAKINMRYIFFYMNGDWDKSFNNVFLYNRNYLDILNISPNDRLDNFKRYVIPLSPSNLEKNDANLDLKNSTWKRVIIERKDI